MADFRVVFSGVSVETWEDPALGVDPFTPTRINPLPEHVHRRHVGQVGVQASVVAVVGPTPALPDGALGGRLFTAFLVEYPSEPPPPIVGVPGQSTVQRFTPNAEGHYTVRMVREGGGSIFVHVDVDS